MNLEGNLIKSFLGHQGSVISLSQSVETEFVSGASDGTARVWDVETGKVKFTLDGHSGDVQVLSLPNGIVITGSADKIIRLWYKGKLEKKIEGHSDIIRGFSEVPNVNGFVSCSNDKTVKLWQLDGTWLLDYKGHTKSVSCVSTLETGEIVSVGDDLAIKVWDEGTDCK